MEDIEKLCAARGLKMTGQRRVIARVLTESDDHPDVEQLHRRAAASIETMPAPADATIKGGTLDLNLIISNAWWRKF